ncbi:MAG TPA: STAS domain-containing protein [Streptosporangiaceae bacterium]|nr:STAS domain-containing protein [Streptosporangiaceae bacterium]
MQLLEISTRQAGRHAVVALRGELDLAGAARLRDRLRTVCEDNKGRVVLDLTELRFVDSTGLSILVEYHEKARSAGGRLILLAPGASVVRILNITGLRERLAIRDRLEDAVDESPDRLDASAAEAADDARRHERAEQTEV